MEGVTIVYRIYIYDDEEEQEVESSEQIDAFLKTVEVLIKEHDLLNEISLPYVPGDNKALINSEPVNADSTDMEYYKQIYENTYLNANYNKGEKKSHLSQLAAECGLDIIFMGWD